MATNGTSSKSHFSSETKITSHSFPAANSTMIEDPNTIKQASPLLFPNLSAAFKPFKKRALSFHNTSNVEINVGEKAFTGSPPKRREGKEAAKQQEEQA